MTRPRPRSFISEHPSLASRSLSLSLPCCHTIPPRSAPTPSKHTLFSRSTPSLFPTLQLSTALPRSYPNFYTEVATLALGVYPPAETSTPLDQFSPPLSSFSPSIRFANLSVDGNAVPIIRDRGPQVLSSRLFLVPRSHRIPAQTVDHDGI